MLTFTKSTLSLAISTGSITGSAGAAVWAVSDVLSCLRFNCLSVRPIYFP